MIFRADTIPILKRTLGGLDPGFLVLLDIDDVLVVAKDALFHPSNSASPLKLDCFRKMREHPPINNTRSSGFFQLLSTVFLEGKRGLVDPSIPNIVSKLQNKHAVIGLTKSEVGKFGKIENFEDWKIKELNKFGINLEKGFCKDLGEIAIKLPLQSYAASLFKSGVLFSNLNSKGETLIAFLDHIEYCPQGVVMIDDLIENLKDIEKQCSQKNINFMGIHFPMAHLQEHTLNPQKVFNQINQLFLEGKWIKD